MRRKAKPLRRVRRPWEFFGGWCCLKPYRLWRPAEEGSFSVPPRIVLSWRCVRSPSPSLGVPDFSRLSGGRIRSFRCFFTVISFLECVFHFLRFSLVYVPLIELSVGRGLLRPRGLGTERGAFSGKRAHRLVAAVRWMLPLYSTTCKDDTELRRDENVPSRRFCPRAAGCGVRAWRCSGELRGGITWPFEFCVLRPRVSCWGVARVNVV